VVLKKKTIQQLQSREDRSLWNFLNYRTIHVRIYTVSIGDRVRDVVEWPGVGAGIRGVNVEYPYVSIIRL
jgi:hypothetical protein